MAHACPSMIFVGLSQKVHKQSPLLPSDFNMADVVHYCLHLYLGFVDENNTVPQSPTSFLPMRDKSPVRTEASGSPSQEL